MGRQRIKLKLKRRRRGSTKKARVVCDFCSRYEQRPHERDHEALSMESELKRLRLLTRRMTGKDPEGLSFNELLLLETHLKEALLIVQQKKKIELEEEEQVKDDGMSREVLVPCSSSEEKQDDQAPPLKKMQTAFERRNAESMEMEFERLWLLKERMNGRMLDGMNCAELGLLVVQITQALLDLHYYRYAPTMEQLARQRREKLISQLRDVPGS